MAKAKDTEQNGERQSAEEMLTRVSEEIDRLNKMGLDAPEAQSRHDAATARFEDGAYHEAEMLASEGVLMARAVREMAAISISVSQKEESERRSVRKQVIREVSEHLTALMSGPLSPERLRMQMAETAEGILEKNLTAKIEEGENGRYFGPAYEEYKQRTKMFVPFVF